MKVLYIGYYKENSEWGKMATNFILSMNAAGIEVVPRAIEMSEGRQVGGLIAELEKGSVEDCDICIQHVFPKHFVGSDKFKKNIALFTNDFVEINHTTMIEYLSQATEVWVTSHDAKSELEKHLCIPVSVVYPGFRSENYRKPYQNVNLPELEGTFKFYTVVNGLSSRDSIISCFHSTFDVTENASLILFSTNPDPSFAQSLNEYSASVKQGLRLKPSLELYRPDAVIHMREASETDIYALHQYADCYVSSSHGDSWPVTAFDAMAFGNTPIVANVGGAKEFNKNVGYLVNSVFSVSLTQGQVSEERNGKDYIITPCHKSIKEAMRDTYDKWEANPIKYSNEKKVAGLQKAEKFSLEKSGARIKEALNV